MLDVQRRVCRNCGVEHFAPHFDGTVVCPICQDPRQFPDPNGQRWLTADELSKIDVIGERIEANLFALKTDPKIGIGHTSYLFKDGPEWVLWDPLPVVATELDHLLGTDHDLSGLVVISSHPHMHGSQTEWARSYDGKVLVNEEDSGWVHRSNFEYEFWSQRFQVGTGSTLFHIGGHFPGSSYLEWNDGDSGSILFVSDTTQIRPNGSFAFQWSYPNMLPLGVVEVERMLSSIPASTASISFDNFGRSVQGDIVKMIHEAGKMHIKRCLS